MAITIDRTAEAVQIKGHDNFAVVEPNHLTAPRNGGVYAQLPAASDITVLEQGTYVKYDYANGEVNFTGKGPWVMVFNEEKLYDERKQMHRDFAQKTADAYDGVIVPRVFAMHAGDIYTTNAVAAGEYEVADILAPGADGILAKQDGEVSGLALQVAATTTLPDGQPAVKLQVISE